MNQKGFITFMKTERGFAPIIILLGIVIASVVGGGAYYIVNTKTPIQKACTMEAKLCPDGSSVGRSGPNCEFAVCPSSKPLPTGGPVEVFEPVTINQLITSMNKFENKKVSVKGTYAGQMTVQVMCVPTASGSAPVISGDYQLYPTTWVITEGKGADTLGVQVLDKNNAVNSTLPNYKMREEIELKGIARAATVSDQCQSNIKHKSIYLEVKEDEVNLTSKPSPQNPPNSQSKKHAMIESMLEQLAQAKDYKQFAQTTGIDLIDGKVRVVLELVDNTYKLPSDFGTEETRSGNLLKVLVKPEKLLQLTEEQKIYWIRQPLKPNLYDIQVPDCSKGPC